MSVPIKYRNIGDFHEYYSGHRQAPYLTLFIGGNHEASNHLFELYYGGWVAPNIYYMGAANVIRFGGLRIAGLSGIWKGYNYNKSHHERLPYYEDDVKSIYHVRELDVRKLLNIKSQVDIGLSHDWPRGVEWLGDWKSLFARKDQFETDARAGTLGSRAARYVLDRLCPPYWFSAHLHCKYSAIIQHSQSTESNSMPRPNAATGPVDHQVDLAQSHNNEEIDLDPEVLGIDSTHQPFCAGQNQDQILESYTQDDSLKLGLETALPVNRVDGMAKDTTKTLSDVPDEVRALLPRAFESKPLEVPSTPAIFNKSTSFLALDKCLPHRKFLQILDIEPIDKDLNLLAGPRYLTYDKEWLAITRVFASQLVLGEKTSSRPDNHGESHYRPLIETEEAWVEKNLVAANEMRIPENFTITAPVYDQAMGIDAREQPKEYTNPQTTAFCRLLHIPNPFDISEEERALRRRKDLSNDVTKSERSRGRGRGRWSGRNEGRGRGGRGRVGFER